MLIPDSELANWQYLAVSGDKEGGLWFVDRTNPGGFDNACSMNPCSCTPTQAGNNVQTYWTGTQYAGHVLHTSPAYWEYDLVTPLVNYIFAGPTNQKLTQYPLCADPHAANPIDTTNSTYCPMPPGGLFLGSHDQSGTPITFSYGVTPAVSAVSSGANGRRSMGDLKNGHGEPRGHDARHLLRV